MKGLRRAVETKRLNLSGPGLACTVACAAMLLASASARANTITVNSTSDAAANDGACTLREAIIAANTNTASGGAAGECAAGAPGLDTIEFNIPGAGVKTIATASPLPAITQAVTIDGYTQSGSSANTNGTTLGSNAILLIYLDMSSQLGLGLNVTAGPTTIRGLAINPTRDIGIFLNVGSDGSMIEGNFIGTNAAGTAAATALSLANGLVVYSSNNFIGGTTPAARNVISGNDLGVNFGSGTSNAASNNRVEGNLIGTNAAGTAAVANFVAGVNVVSPGVANVIGGTTAAVRNIISGNAISGVVLQEGSLSTAGANLVQGNYIGVDVTGTAALPNGKQGVSVSSLGNVIGGTTAGAGNVISGNGSTSSLGYANANVDADATGRGSPGTLIQGNLIGTNAAGTAAPTGLPGVETVGIILGTDATAGGISAGAGNVIAFNPGVGVLVNTSSAQRAAILSNSIYSNVRLGIDLGGATLPAVGDGVTPNDACDADSGPNNLQNFPVITSAPIAAGSVTISGTLNSVASTTYRIEFFSSVAGDVSGNGEGQTFIGFANVTTDASCNATFGPLVLPVPPGQTFITATATDPSNNTSEFSAWLSGAPGPTPTPTPTVTPTTTPTVAPTTTPGGPPAAASSVPTLSGGMIALLGIALVATALVLLRRGA
jgi:CSLREA domain-containing protein